jgi:hypothetical protein
MDRKRFEEILGAGRKAFGNRAGRKLEELKDLVRRVEAGELPSLLSDAGEQDLYDAVYGDCDGNEFTNEAVHVFCALALEYYGNTDAPLVVGN